MTAATIAVLGGGAWGTRAGADGTRGPAMPSRLWARDAEIVASLNGRRENPRYLPGIALEPGIARHARHRAAPRGADLRAGRDAGAALRAALSGRGRHVPTACPLVLCAKGIERGTGSLLSAVVEETVPAAPVAALSGPSFASDVARGLPTAVVVASAEADSRARLPPALSAPNFRCYSSATT